MLGYMLRMTKEHVIVFIQVVLGIIMLYCGCLDIIWDIMTTMRHVNSKCVIKAYAADMGMRLRELAQRVQKNRYLRRRQQGVQSQRRHGDLSVDRRKLFLQAVNWYWVPIVEALVPSWFRGATKPEGKNSKKTPNRVGSPACRFDLGLYHLVPRGGD